MKTFLLSSFFVLSAVFSNAATIPNWYPEDYDLDAASKNVIAALKIQGEDIDFSDVKSVIFSDADQTLLKTSTPLFLKHKVTGQLLTYPQTRTLVRLRNLNWEATVVDLKSKYPDIEWDDYEIDYHEMGSIVAINSTPSIPVMLEYLEKSGSNSFVRQYIVTARSDDTVSPALKDYFFNLGFHIDGVFPVNNEALAGIMDYKDLSISTAQKKSLVMAAIIKLCPNIEDIKFYDDGDSNLIMAMELLPSLFPSVSYSFFDVIHSDKGFEVTLIAESISDNDLVAPDGHKLTPQEIREYSSIDTPIS